MYRMNQYCFVILSKKILGFDKEKDVKGTGN
jgi:hypothetical protein